MNIDTEELTPMTALGPLDGRYAAKTAVLRGVFSEAALIRQRVRVEVFWLETLCGEPAVPEARALSPEETALLESLADNFSAQDAARVKDIERTTNHDVKAVEYYLRERLADTSLVDVSEFLHFACTSEDINNLAYTLMVGDGREVLLTVQQELIDALRARAHADADIPMLARTHGQPASPTTLGKEWAVYADRLARHRTCIESVPLRGKMNGAVGNFNAHAAACPGADWPRITRELIEQRLGLTQTPYTTQVEPQDGLAELFHALARFNRTLLDLDRDVWLYVSRGALKQKTRAGEVGSSTMPHKVNPLDFENSEGNLGIACRLLEHLAAELPVSRMQRDLSGSTVLRNIGVAFGHSLLAFRSSLRGMEKLEPNGDALRAELDGAWEVLAEPVQTVMRKAGLEHPYERLKELTRGKAVTRESLHEFIRGLELPEEDRDRLLALTPAAYIGLAADLARDI
ncbi:adenylosuccinate lyase [Kiritimatiella glycovorans]|uniref:Adenylosuccinate lyase n=1 Tax=Kiritimatiella glycovorans TaxID=1307763 RepID=A0A0G3EA40_9BACT|nr:adenylosuccinate lyase [Kiritimatiella glycovorans]AKJ63306.1 Adenylosuccinate lyase [Kiritimatiella glycovorans]